MPSRTAVAPNPFADPNPPTATTNTTTTTVAPPPPPKQHAYKHGPARPSQTSRTSNDLMAAVRDTVAVRPQDRPEHAYRTRPSRSQTSTAPPPVARPAGGSRSISTDSAPRSTEKPRHKSKKASGSAHADVIDRLDFSGVGPMFHHDGPFDACAPSRNRQRQKAPMYAWTGVNPEDEQAYREKEGFTRKNISPAKVPSSPYYDDYVEPPNRKNVDAIAEAWGIHEPEPFEDFSAGGGGGDGQSAPGSRNGTYAKRERERPRRDAGNDRTPRRAAIPPPQPIFTGDDPVVSEAYPPSPNAGANLGRNKSLMQRIRKMRDAPNVPVGGSDVPANGNGSISPTSSGEGGQPSRAAQRSQPSAYPARYGRNDQGEMSPDSFVYVDDPKAKDLPPPPQEDGTPSPSAEGPDGYFAPQIGGGGIGRKNSLMRKMRGVVNRK